MTPTLWHHTATPDPSLARAISRRSGRLSNTQSKAVNLPGSLSLYARNAGGQVTKHQPVAPARAFAVSDLPS